MSFINDADDIVAGEHSRILENRIFDYTDQDYDVMIANVFKNIHNADHKVKTEGYIDYINNFCGHKYNVHKCDVFMHGDDVAIRIITWANSLLYDSLTVNYKDNLINDLNKYCPKHNFYIKKHADILNYIQTQNDYTNHTSLKEYISTKLNESMLVNNTLKGFLRDCVSDVDVKYNFIMLVTHCVDNIISSYHCKNNKYNSCYETIGAIKYNVNRCDASIHNDVVAYRILNWTSSLSYNTCMDSYKDIKLDLGKHCPRYNFYMKKSFELLNDMHSKHINYNELNNTDIQFMFIENLNFLPVKEDFENVIRCNFMQAAGYCAFNILRGYNCTLLENQHSTIRNPRTIWDSPNCSNYSYNTSVYQDKIYASLRSSNYAYIDRDDVELLYNVCGEIFVTLTALLVSSVCFGLVRDNYMQFNIDFY